MIRAVACPHLLFDWPREGTNSGWSFISGQSLCLQWHHKCPCRENNGWWIQWPSGTVDNSQKNSSVMESFQTIKGTHLGQTPFQNVVRGGSGFGDSGGEGRALLGTSGYNTKCLYEALRAGDAPREERRFVFPGCLECVEDCGRLLY